jgi:hypothetical protein
LIKSRIVNLRKDPGDDWDNDFAESTKKSQPNSMMGGWGGGATMESLLAAATGKGNPSVEKAKQTPSMGFSMGSGAKKGCVETFE